MGTRVWSRAHDALIARVAEGLEVITAEETCRRCRIVNRDSIEQMRSGSGWWVQYSSDYDWEPLARHNTDIVAGIRAAEKWRAKDPDIDRTVELHSAVERMDKLATAQLNENYRVGEAFEWRSFDGEGADYAEALAWALWTACGGVE